MCFNEKQSYVNAIILLLIGIIKFDNKKIACSLIFLSIKDLLQGLLYKYNNDQKINNILTTLSWIHICFQPLIVNIFMSNFDKNNDKYWNNIFLICLIYGICQIFTLKELELYDDDFYSNQTQSYIGKYHLGYKFNRQHDTFFKFPLYFIYPAYIFLCFLPSLFAGAGSKIVSLITILFVINLKYLFYDVRNGEFSAMWCFLTLICAVPMSLLEKYILELN